MIDLTTIPTNPGCYLYKDYKGTIIYVGKAKNLKKRVTSYFQKKDHGTKTIILVNKIHSVDFIVTDNEIEALILENNLIKKHYPKYNINLKDSKRYAYLKITNEEFARLVIARKKSSGDKSKYFGPFTSGESRDYIKEIVTKTFKIRTCKKLPKKECLRFHIGLCDAPCTDKISKKDYDRLIGHAKKVLSGKTEELLLELKSDMSKFAKNQIFENAIQCRNQINALMYLQEKQKAERNRKYDEDIINYTIKKGIVYLLIFHSKRGMLESKEDYEFIYKENFMESFLTQYYTENKIPKEIIIPKKIANDSGELVLEFLNHESNKSNKIHSRTKSTIVVPRIGEKKHLLDLVLKNVDVHFFGNIKRVENLKKYLKLGELPLVIECFDISHLGGTMTVASMVQFRNGKPDKNNYRRYKIKTVNGIDDFASIKEVVYRRYKRLQDEGREFPNLIIIDGGKGQLSSSVAMLNDLGVKIPIVSLAKRKEDVFVPGLEFPIIVPKKSQAQMLIQALRDEAHRFAITYNKNLRSKKLKNEFGSL